MNSKSPRNQWGQVQQQREQREKPSLLEIKELEELPDKIETCPLIAIPREIRRSYEIECERYARKGNEIHKRRMAKLLQKFVEAYQKWELSFLPFAPPDIKLLGEGDVPLGIINETDFVNAFDAQKEGTAHIIIAGPPGVGKTNLLFWIILALKQAGHFVHLFSPKEDELLRLFSWFADESNFHIINKTSWHENPFEAPVPDPQWIMQVTNFWPDSMLSGRGYLAQTLIDLQRKYNIKNPSLIDLESYTHSLRVARKQGGLASSEHNREALQRQGIRIKQLLYGVNDYSVRKGYPYTEIIKRNNFFLYGGIKNPDVRNFFVRCVLTKLWAVKRSMPELRKRLDFFIIDDAQELVQYTGQKQEKVLDTIEDIALHARSTNTGLILAVQNYSLIEPAIRRNASIIIAFMSGSEDAGLIGKDMGFEKAEQYRALMSLPRGHCIAYRRLVLPQPVVVCPPEFIAEPVPVETIQEYMKPVLKEWMKYVEPTPSESGELFFTEPAPQTGKARSKAQSDKEEFTDQEIAFMMFYKKSPGSVREEMESELKLTPSTLDRLLKSLVKKGCLKTTIAENHNGQVIEVPFMLKPSKARMGKARQFYDFDEKGVTRFGNPEWVGKCGKMHAIAMAFIRYFYRKNFGDFIQGIFLEKQIGSGEEAVDISIEPKLVAIEVCNTTKPDSELHNIKKAFNAGYKMVISASFAESKRTAIQKEAQQHLTAEEIVRVKFILVGDFLGRIEDKAMFFPTEFKAKGD